MLPTGDEQAKLKTVAPNIKRAKERKKLREPVFVVVETQRQRMPAINPGGILSGVQWTMCPIKAGGCRNLPH